MTDEEKNQATAELCGIPVDVCMCGGSEQSHCIGGNEHSFSPMADAPDYGNDLNACREFEKTLGDKALDYDKILQEVFHRGARVCHWQSYPGDYIWHATAAQRQEAFLRLHGIDLEAASSGVGASKKSGAAS